MGDNLRINKNNVDYGLFGEQSWGRNDMDEFDDQIEMLNQEDAFLVRMVAERILYSNHAEHLELYLREAENGGWGNLVAAIRSILGGERSLSSFMGLDAEDRRIAVAILRSLEDATEMPDIAETLDPKRTGLKIATLILAARCGNQQAGESLENLLAAMNSSRGEMPEVGMAIIQVFNGERDVEILCRRMGPVGTRIVESLLAELGKRELVS